MTQAGFTDSTGKFRPFSNNKYKDIVPQNNIAHYHPSADYVQKGDYHDHIYEKQNRDEMLKHKKFRARADELGVKTPYGDDGFMIEFNHKNTFDKVDKLKKKFPNNVTYIKINKYGEKDPILLTDVPRQNFAFDYAVGGLSQAEKNELEQHVKDYRNEKIDDPKATKPWNVRVFERLAFVDKILDRHDMVVGAFS